MGRHTADPEPTDRPIAVVTREYHSGSLIDINGSIWTVGEDIQAGTMVYLSQENGMVMACKPPASTTPLLDAAIAALDTAVKELQRARVSKEIVRDLDVSVVIAAATSAQALASAVYNVRREAQER